MKRFRKFRFHVTNFYFYVLSKVIPCKILTIRFKNPLDPEKSLYGTHMIPMGTEHLDLDDVLDAVFGMTSKMLRDVKNVTNFSGLVIETPRNKFEIFYRGAGYTPETNPDRKVEDET